MAAEPWELHPYEGAGPLRFGMSRREVIDLLGMPQVVIHREPFLVEAVGDVHPEYSRGDCLVGVVTAGSSPLAWRGIMLTGRPVREVERDLQAAGVEIDDGEDGPSCPASGSRFTRRRTTTIRIGGFRGSSSRAASTTHWTRSAGRAATARSTRSRTRVACTATT